LLAGLRTMLDRPQLADLVIPDLARWEDWSAMNRLVDLFKNADEESSWVRVPVVKYLQACPLPEAKTRLAELAKLDPEVVKRANTFFPFASGATGAAKVPAAEKEASEKDASNNGTAEKGAGDAKAPPKAKTPDPQKSSSSTGAPIGSDMAAATVTAATETSEPAQSAAVSEATKAAPQRATSALPVGKPAVSANTAGDEPRAVAAIGSTSLAPKATGTKPGRIVGPWQVCGGLVLAGIGVMAMMAWLLLGGQHDGQRA
jgi:hypothetical protein